VARVASLLQGALDAVAGRTCFVADFHFGLLGQQGNRLDQPGQIVGQRFPGLGFAAAGVGNGDDDRFFVDV